jgi:hypothetical protein
MRRMPIARDDLAIVPGYLSPGGMGYLLDPYNIGCEPWVNSTRRRRV